MLDDRDSTATYEPEHPQAILAQRNQDTRDSIRGKRNYRPGTGAQFAEPNYWPSYPPHDLPIEAAMWEDAEDYS
jgi:hypothetical protein